MVLLRERLNAGAIWHIITTRAEEVYSRVELKKIGNFEK